MIRHSAIAALTFACLFIVGCASSQHAGDAMHATQSTGPGGAAHVNVPVELDEYVIRMPSKIPPGDATFDVKNVGHHTHNIKIQGKGVDAELPEDLHAGKSATMDVHLDPGTYKVICPVGPHAALGMKRTVTVK